MTSGIKKIGQQTNESSFTEADLATAISLFLSGMNQFYALGMVKADIPDVLSGVVGLVSSVLVAKPGADYMERELMLGISKEKKEKNDSSSTDKIYNAFAIRVARRIKPPFNKFLKLMEYIEELLTGKVPGGNSNTAEYKNLEHLILRSKNKNELKNNLFILIKEISTTLDNINNIAGTNFSIINQLMFKKPAISTEIGIDENTLSSKKFDLNNLPNNLISKLTDLYKEFFNLKILFDIVEKTSNNYSGAALNWRNYNIANPSNKTTQKTKQQNQQSGASTASLLIKRIFNVKNFTYDQSTSSIKLDSLTSSSQPSFTLEIECNTKNLNEYDLFQMLYKNNLLRINDGAGISDQNFITALNQVRDIITNSSSNNLLLTLLKSSKADYNLKIDFPQNIAQQLHASKGFDIFEIIINNQPFLVKTGLDKYFINDGFSKISFNLNDLIDDSSNISKLERAKILAKIKK